MRQGLNVYAKGLPHEILEYTKSFVHTSLVLIGVLTASGAVSAQDKSPQIIDALQGVCEYEAECNIIGGLLDRYGKHDAWTYVMQVEGSVGGPISQIQQFHRQTPDKSLLWGLNVVAKQTIGQDTAMMFSLGIYNDLDQSINQGVLMSTLHTYEDYHEMIRESQLPVYVSYTADHVYGFTTSTVIVISNTLSGPLLGITIKNELGHANYKQRIAAGEIYLRQLLTVSQSIQLQELYSDYYTLTRLDAEEEEIFTDNLIALLQSGAKANRYALTRACVIESEFADTRDLTALKKLIKKKLYQFLATTAK